MNKLYLLILLFPLLSVIIFFYNVGMPEVGEHVGYITETGYAGYFWKTHYVKVVSSHFVSNDVTSSWNYGIDEQSSYGYHLFKLAQSYQEQDKLVKISFRCDWIVPIWQRTNACVILNIVGAKE